MVVGKGLIGKAFLSEFETNDDVIVFASGVSNSNEKRISEFDREKKLLLSTLQNKPEALIIYFSTYSIGDLDSISRPYVVHKEEMESIVRGHSRFLILRVSNVVGNMGNPNTVINFFVEKINAGEPISIWNSAIRNLIDIDDLYEITKELVKNKVENKQLLVTNPNSLYVSDIVAQIADFKKTIVKTEIINKGNDFEMNPSHEVLKIIESLNLNFDENYFLRLLNKYY